MRKERVDCPYKDRCKSYPDKCFTCENNRNNKKDFYKPLKPKPLNPYRQREYWRCSEK